ncbi:MAG: class I SAM-dependent methyltransferase [bacterium]
MASSVWRSIQRMVYQFNLDRLADLYQTDKGSGHGYMKIYRRFLRPYKFRPVRLLEIGVGGRGPTNGGASLRMWKNYFPFGKIYALDLFDKSQLEEPGIRIFQGDQSDPDALRRVTDESGDLDIIIDDGSHRNDHVVKTFELLFPRLKTGGLYFVEDAQTSYWPSYGGSSKDLQKAQTLMNFFKHKADSIHYPELILEGPSEPDIYDKHITGLHFSRSLIVIEKGDNSRPSTLIVNHKAPAWL